MDNNILSHFITLVMCNDWRKGKENCGLQKSASGVVIMWDPSKRVGGRECVYVPYIPTLCISAPPTVIEFVSLSILTINKFAIKCYKTRNT